MSVYLRLPAAECAFNIFLLLQVIVSVCTSNSFQTRDRRELSSCLVPKESDSIYVYTHKRVYSLGETSNDSNNQQERATRSTSSISSKPHAARVEF